MQKLKSILFKLFFPNEAGAIKGLDHVLVAAGKLVGHRVVGWRHLHQLIDDMADSRRAPDLLQDNADCLEALISLVSINEDGHWSTVFDADTLLPNHIQDYLHRVVARS